MVAELTYRCPLACAYCSNPVRAGGGPALLTEEWARVLSQASGLGVVQVHLSGGEPLLREDLELLVGEARRHALYANLVTSGVPLDRARLERLRGAGLEAVQLSLQAADAARADRLAGRPVFRHKLRVARWIKALGLPLTINVVLHRGNLDQVGAMVELAERLGADRLELANAQYLGWALHNRAALLPSAAAIAQARAVALEARARLQGRLELVFVLPDYLAGRPRPCMEGWARRYVVVTPEGRVLPCHGAQILPLDFESVRERELAEIWADSPALQAFRGEAWMKQPCRSCPERGRDFGGCRCQTFALLGDAGEADPACARSPHHELVLKARQEAAVRPPELRPRRLPLTP